MGSERVVLGVISTLTTPLLVYSGSPTPAPLSARLLVCVGDSKRLQPTNMTYIYSFEAMECMRPPS